MTIDPAAHDLDAPRKRVGVIARLHPDQERLLTALERAFPVDFVQVGVVDQDEVDGLLVIGSTPPDAVPGPAPSPGTVHGSVPPSGAVVGSTSLPDARAAIPRLVLPRVGLGGQQGDSAIDSHETTPVALAEEPVLARPLRGKAIPEAAVAEELPLAHPGGDVLARVGGRPVWWQLGDATAALSVSAYPLAGLREGEALRDHLRVGCFMGLLPLVHFLGLVLGEEGWRAPPLRAAFVIDDPNLHWPSYGFLKYGELVAHAARHGYHVAFATVPIDGWRADPRVASLLAANRSVLSLVMHGNDHVASELARLSTDAQAQPVIAQALRRVAALERRSGVAVDRVMTPPHGACSEAALRAMFRLGIEAVSVAPIYPRQAGMPVATPLAGWHPAELVAGGLSVLPRHPLDASREELALRAVLGQPLILYGHHEDFADGLDLLARAASEIDGLGDVRWGPLGEIARRSYATRRLDGTLHVRMHARRITVEVPAGVHTLRVLLQEPLGGAAGHRLTHAGGSVGIAFGDGVGASELLAIDGPTRIGLTLAADRPLSPAEVPTPGTRLWPWIRRALAEGQDRVEALR